ncbi:hypothetical protein LTR67_008919 [Exophiala xenobiotica]
MSYYNEGYGQQQYGQAQNYNNERPRVPEPWVTEWDARDNRWIFVNRQTGDRSFEYPQQSYNSGYGGNNVQEYDGQNQRGYYEQEPQKESHTGRNVALGVVGGALGGALLMHEGEKVEDKWDEDKYRLENDARQGIDNVEDFPEDAARWTGRGVQDVEDIPQDIENKYDNAVQDVEDVPQDVADWAGRKVGDVEGFDDNMDNAYDQGRDQSRYDDDDYRDNY